ncbi:unnamed protein product [Lactuca virosa]|uniref:Uncharacterized protein n=1 Tax=Lactuca virosa TaxID=75947 RepID=A0AAU9P723_9ASTR|nr:unnamed protein product [Lactuca virosa]
MTDLDRTTSDLMKTKDFKGRRHATVVGRGAARLDLNRCGGVSRRLREKRSRQERCVTGARSGHSISPEGRSRGVNHRFLGENHRPVVKDHRSTVGDHRSIMNHDKSDENESF